MFCMHQLILLFIALLGLRRSARPTSMFRFHTSLVYEALTYKAQCHLTHFVQVQHVSLRMCPERAFRNRSECQSRTLAYRGQEAFPAIPVSLEAILLVHPIAQGFYAPSLSVEVERSCKSHLAEFTQNASLEWCVTLARYADAKGRG